MNWVRCSRKERVTKQVEREGLDKEKKGDEKKGEWNVRVCGRVSVLGLVLAEGKR